MESALHLTFFYNTFKIGTNVQNKTVPTVTVKCNFSFINQYETLFLAILSEIKKKQFINSLHVYVENIIMHIFVKIF